MIGVFTFGDGSQPDKTRKVEKHHGEFQERRADPPSPVISKNSSSKLYECLSFF